MPEQSTEAKSKVDAKVKPVDDAYAAAISGGQPGFKMVVDGEEVTAMSRKEFRKLQATGEKDLKSEPSPEDKRPSKRRASLPVVEPETDLELTTDKIEKVLSTAKDVAPKTKEPEKEPEVIELEEVDFLKAHGIYNEKFCKTIADVDRDIEYQRQQLQNLDGYEGNEYLFHPDAVATPEQKITTLRALRSTVGKVRHTRTIEKEAAKLVEKREEPAKPKSIMDYLDEVDKARLDDPTPENLAYVLEKISSIKTQENLAPIVQRLNKLDFNFLKQERNIDDNRELALRNLLNEKPYLKKAIANLSMEETIELLDTFHTANLSDAEKDAFYEKGVKDQKQLRLKQQAAITLKPGRATRTSPEAEIDSDLLAKVAQARQARKEGKRVKVSPILAETLARRRFIPEEE